MLQRLFIAICALFIVTGCSKMDPVAEYPTRQEGDDDLVYNNQRDSVFGESGINIFGNKDKKQGGGSGIGVNAYLWRASLDTVSFMPISSADPFGGTILTDWYEPDPSKNERLKLNIIILDTNLRADGVRVSAFRQVKDNAGLWRDAPVAPGTTRQLEDTILTRARQLRVAQTGR